LVVTNSVLSLEGDCVSPSFAIQELLTGSTTASELTRLEPRYRTLLSSTGIAPDIISAATVFTTHRDLDMLVEVAQDVRERTFDWLAPPLCEDEGGILHCEGVFEAYDYRRDGRYIEDSEVDAQDIWILPVSVWLPLDGEGPFPTILYAHGINDQRGSGEYLAEIVVPEGFAVIASDALEHNDHPTHTEDDISMDSLRFLGIDTQSFSLDALTLRGNFNQTTVDRLQLIELMRAHPDVDGDGQADLDIDHLAYYGISMGGMLGSSMTALSDDFGAAVFSVAGGGLLTFVTDNEQVAPAVPLLMDLMGGEAVFERLLIIAQAVIDAADPATFAPFVVQDRLLGEPIHVLFPVAIKDDTVPPSTARILARGLGLPQVQPVIEPVALLTLSGSGPVHGNMRDGLVTGGHFQYDRVSSDDGPVEATHDNLSLSEESSTQFIHFLQSWIEDGVPEIIDPYEALQTLPLP
jgi:dienelactone hydrolase